MRNSICTPPPEIADSGWFGKVYSNYLRRVQFSTKSYTAQSFNALPAFRLETTKSLRPFLQPERHLLRDSEKKKRENGLLERASEPRLSDVGFSDLIQQTALD